MLTKKVAYLFGAGASHAVVSDISPQTGLLTDHVRERIRDKHTRVPPAIDEHIWSELIKDDVDIEHLISVVDTLYNSGASELLRKYYREAICNLAMEAGPYKGSNLYAVLIDMHNVKKLREDISCFITLNYEDILEQTLINLFGYSIDFGFNSTHSVLHKPSKNKTVKLLKLHGSFSWDNTRPIYIKDLSQDIIEAPLWIPPGVEKKKDNYPFNFLWGQALECLLQCDILRIVGCSLSRNDWGLIPLIYTAQALAKRNRKSPRNLEIQIINYPKTCNEIKDNYKYIKFTTLQDLPEIQTRKTDILPDAASEDAIEREFEININSRGINIFNYWLDAKLEALIYQKYSKDHKILTRKRFANNFYWKERNGKK